MMELLVVIVPILLILVNALEFSRYTQCKMVLQHAAVVAVRSCAVTRNTMNPGFTGSADDYKKAARAAVLPWRNAGRLNLAEVTCEDPADPRDDSAVLTSKLRASYTCLSPLSFCLAMRRGNPSVIMRVSATYPRQGAKYDVHYE